MRGTEMTLVTYSQYIWETIPKSLKPTSQSQERKLELTNSPCEKNHLFHLVNNDSRDKSQNIRGRKFSCLIAYDNFGGPFIIKKIF